MKKLTFIITFIGIVAGISLICFNLLNPIVGFVLGSVFVAPLFVTLAMSRLLAGTGTQIALLCSTAIYLPYLIYLFCVDLQTRGHFNFLALSYSAPIMIALWFTAAVLSKTRAEQAEDSKEP
jgi:hypothetical protein